ncbi:MAG TPA: hypothetical protein DD990_27380, partial [Cyanobacteria bacterium UBA11368]|nr:hypothetical protein [Cyanobacteria bacterium UBA11368]
MQKRILFAVSWLLLGGMALSCPQLSFANEPFIDSDSIAEPEEPSDPEEFLQPQRRLLNPTPQQPTSELDRLLQQGRQLTEAGNFAPALAVYQQAANLERNNARIFSAIGFIQA